MCRLLIALLLAIGGLDLVAGDPLDWPTWRSDNTRSGLYPQELPESLHLRWVYQATHKPREAWPGTAQFDSSQFE